MALTKRPVKRDIDLEAVRQDVGAFYAVKHQMNLIAQKVEQNKNALKALVQKYGQVDPANGSVFLDLGDPVGAGERQIRFLKNQRSETDTLNREEAERILRAKGLWEECTETVVEIDQSRIHAKYYDNEITDDELARMFNRRVSFSFFLLDADRKPVS